MFEVMKIMNRICAISGLLSIALVLGLLTSCKNKEADSSKYVKELSDIAAQYNKSCPKDEPNGTKLESVTFEGNTMTYRLSLSDEAITTINLDNSRDSIIDQMSDKLKKYMIKGNCKLVYKYVATNDSSSITILPSELGKVDSKEK